VLLCKRALEVPNATALFCLKQKRGKLKFTVYIGIFPIFLTLP